MLCKMFNQQLAAAFETWATMAADAAGAREEEKAMAKAAKILTRFVKKGASMAMRAWSDYAWYRRTTRNKIAKRLAAMGRDRLHMSLWSWSDVVRDRRSNESRVRKLLGRLLGEKKTVCFLSWSHSVKAAREEVSLTLRSVHMHRAPDTCRRQHASAVPRMTAPRALLSPPKICRS